MRRHAPRPLANQRGLTSIDGANALIGLLVIVQMWLLTATLEAYLAGHDDAVLPAAIASGVLSLGCFLLYRFARNADRQSRRRP